MFAGTADETCPYARAVETAKILGDTVTHFESIEGWDHFSFSDANNEWFMEKLLKELQVPETNVTGEDEKDQQIYAEMIDLT